MNKDNAAAVAGTRIRAYRGGGAAPRARADRIAVEAPLELRMGPLVTTVLMRTPGDDEDLARGFLFTEGVITAAGDLRGLRRPPGLRGGERGNVLEVDLDPRRGKPDLRRLFPGSSSCGACGKMSIESLAVIGGRVASRLRIPRSVLAALPDRMREAQRTFGATGGVHASALFTAAGDLLVLREDVGRHNALDKIVGWGLAGGRLPFADAVLLVSGRVSYEILQKAIAAGIPVVAAVGAPSSFAVDLARRFGVTLVGFLRGDSMNVYARPARVVGRPSRP